MKYILWALHEIHLMSPCPQKSKWLCRYPIHIWYKLLHIKHRKTRSLFYEIYLYKDFWLKGRFFCLELLVNCSLHLSVVGARRVMSVCLRTRPSTRAQLRTEGQERRSGCQMEKPDAQRLLVAAQLCWNTSKNRHCVYVTMPALYAMPP
jgi:hypothetical protein